MTDIKTLSNVQIKDAVQGLVTAVFCTYDVVDLGRDVIRKGAIADGAKVVMSAYGHTSHTGALPIGKGSIRSVGNTAVFDGQFFLNTAAGADAFTVVNELSRDGLGEWSWSLQNIVSTQGTVDGKAVRIITKVDVKEVCPVLIAESIGTRTLATKAAACVNAQVPPAVMAEILLIGLKRGMFEDDMTKLIANEEARFEFIKAGF